MTMGESSMQMGLQMTMPFPIPLTTFAPLKHAANGACGWSTRRRG
jgi:hypothetical protein